MDSLTEDRVEALLRAAEDVRCVVVGDVMLDRYVTGTVDRISPEAPVDAESSASRRYFSRSSASSLRSVAR